MNYIKLSIVLFAACLSACASLDHVEQYDYRFDHESGRFPPVRLYVNREQVMGPALAGMVNALYKEIRATGAFHGSSAFAETPWVIDIQLGWLAGNAAGSFIGMMASAATLGVLPSKHDQIYVAEVSVYQAGMLLEAFKIEEQSSMVMSVYNYAETVSGEAHQMAMKNIALRLVERLDKTGMLPRIQAPGEEPDPDFIRT